MSAAAPLAASSTTGALVWSAVLVVIIVLLFGAIRLYRKWMNADDDTTGGGFTLGDLRKLHREGQMSDEEFEKAKAVLLGSLKASMAATDKPAQGPRNNPPPPPLQEGDDAPRG